MFERLTRASRQVLATAQHEAQHLGRNEVAPEHLLLGLLDTEGLASDVLHAAGVDSGTVRAALRRRLPAGTYLSVDDAAALRSVGIDLDVVLDRLVASFGSELVAQTRPRLRRVRFSHQSKRVLQLAVREAVWLKSGSIGSEHLLLGLLRSTDDSVTELLSSCGANADDLRVTLLQRIGRAA